jgi:hypothetical protein
MYNIRNNDGTLNGQLASERFEVLTNKLEDLRQRGFRILHDARLAPVKRTHGLADQVWTLLRRIERAEKELHAFDDEFVTEADLDVAYSWSLI